MPSKLKAFIKKAIKKRKVIILLFVLGIISSAAPDAKADIVPLTSNFTSETSFNSTTDSRFDKIKLNFNYEGRFSLVDIGDSAGRHGIYNILWTDFNTSDGGNNIFLRLKTQNFEGDSYIKQFNGMNEQNTTIFTDAYLQRAEKNFKIKFGLFHIAPAGPNERAVELRDFTYGFDPMNEPYAKKGQGNFEFSRFINNISNDSVEVFANYKFDVDYSNSLKILGAKYKGMTFLNAFNDQKTISYADLCREIASGVALTLTGRVNKFKYLDAINQYSGGINVKIAKLLKYQSVHESLPVSNIALNKKAATNEVGLINHKLNFLRHEPEIGIEILENRTTNNYYLLKRNIVDILDASVIFPYQKNIIAAKFNFLFKDPTNSAFELKYYDSLTPQYKKSDGLEADIAKMKVINAKVNSFYRKLNFETSFMKVLNNDGSNMINEKSNFRIKVLYPF